MKIYLFLFIAAFILLGFPLAAQSGWVKEKGALYAQAGFYTFSSSDYYSVDGQLLDDGGVLATSIFSIYGEYGLGPRFTLIGDLPLLARNKFSTTNAVAAQGDIRLGLKYGVSQQKLPISLGVGVELPTGKQDLPATAREPNSFGVVERINLPTGDGEWNVLATLAASKPFLAGRGYGSAFAAYNFRTKGYSGQVRLGLELGAQPLPGLWLFGKLFSQLKGLEGSTEDASFFRGEGTTFTQLSFGGQYMPFGQWGFTASVFFPVNHFITEFKNVYAAPAFSVGVVYQSESK